MAPEARGLRRWVIYQRERFPLAAHGALILAFSLSAVCFSALLRDTRQFPAWPVCFVAFASSFFSFLHLRLADEFKDIEDDRQFRPYRPVPRGLVTLRELGLVWALTGLAQLGLALWLDPRLAPLLLLVWVYLSLMSREFFCKTWLKAHPLTYMGTHMVILPLIDFYATACDWMTTSGRPPNGLWWFVIVSFLNGFIIEIGRKIRAPHEEEAGVETYSALWGRTAAVRCWLLAMLLTGLAAFEAARRIDFLIPVAVVLAALWGVAFLTGRNFLRTDQRSGKPIEMLSGVWTLCLYLVLGVVPMLGRMLP